MEKIIGNSMYYKTFGPKNVNQSTIEYPEYDYKKLSMESDERVDISAFKDVEYAVNSESIKINEEFGNLYRFHNSTSDKEYREILKLNIDDKNPELFDTHDVVADENSSLNLFIDYSSENGNKKFRNSIIRVLAKKNSKVNLAIIQRDSKDCTAIQSVLVEIEEGARVDVLEYQLGAKKLYTNMQANLRGDNSEFYVDGIYYGFSDNELDLLYNIFHYGKNSNSDVNINGTLRDSSTKSFKSTLDFKEGSSKSVGSEEEYVILLGEEAHSMSVPTLLSHEDDVVGNHAASAGKIDQKLMFYIMSRGFSEEEAENLIIKSKFASAIGKLDDGDLRCEIWRRIEEITGGIDVK